MTRAAALGLEAALGVAGRLGRLAAALRCHWRRILLGALGAWALVNVAAIVAMIVLEARQTRYPDYAAAQVVYAALVVSLPVGALVGYATRRRP